MAVPDFLVWCCAGCGAAAQGKKKPCNCVTNVGTRAGPNGIREQTWWDHPDADLIGRMQSYAAEPWAHQDNWHDLMNEGAAALSRATNTRADRDEKREAWRPTHRHYKGSLHRVIGEAVHTETSAFLTVYDHADGSIFALPQGLFHGKLEDGRDRFAALPEEEPGR